jgi:hypothetical protein
VIVEVFELMTDSFVVLPLEQFGDVKKLQGLRLNDFFQPEQTDVGNKVLKTFLKSIHHHFEVSFHLLH